MHAQPLRFSLIPDVVTLTTKISHQQPLAGILNHGEGPLYHLRLSGCQPGGPGCMAQWGRIFPCVTFPFCILSNVTHSFYTRGPRTQKGNEGELG